MKKALFVAFLLVSHLNFAQQDQSRITDPFYYKVVGLMYAYNYNINVPKPETTFKIPKRGLGFEVVRKELNPAKTDSIYVIEFFNLVKATDEKLGLFGSDKFINADDNDKYFWVSKPEFDALLQQGVFKKSYNRNYRPTFGANVSLPFKFRPKTEGENLRITPDITLGGFIGGKFRIHRTERFYLTIPVVTLGLATLPITGETVDAGANDLTGDGLVLGVTASTGLVFQLDDFQMGFMTGWDHAAGELGRNWIYNSKQWYSFSIGYTFFGNKKEKEEQGN